MEQELRKQIVFELLRSKNFNPEFWGDCDHISHIVNVANQIEIYILKGFIGAGSCEEEHPEED